MSFNPNIHTPYFVYKQGTEVHCFEHNSMGEAYTHYIELCEDNNLPISTTINEVSHVFNLTTNNRIQLEPHKNFIMWLGYYEKGVSIIDLLPCNELVHSHNRIPTSVAYTSDKYFRSDCND